jgi:glycosyltransferase involved in cell wall biosynthesis
MSHTKPSKIFVVGQRALETHAKLGFRADKMVCVPNGYEAPSTKTLAQGTTRHAPTEPIPQICVFGMVARYHPQKDHRGLLRALSLLKSRRTDWVFRLVGEGVVPGNHALVEEVLRLELSDNVQLLGRLQDPTEFYESLDVHVLSSAFGEGFPNVVAESMLAGVPNVVTHVGDAAEIVADTGWIAQPSDPDDLAGVLEAALICAPSERRARGERAKDRILASYSLPAMVESHRREYERKRLVAYPRYSRLGASSRVRMFQFEEVLGKNGWDVGFYPFSDDAFLQARYGGKKAWASVSASYLRRIHSLREMRTADLVWVEKELIPWAPAWFERALISYRGKIVYDFDDAVHEQFRENPHAIVRATLSNKIAHTVRHSSAVLAGNYTLEQYFSREVAVPTLFLPSTIDMSRLNLTGHTAGSERKPFIFGWIGTPVTYHAYVAPLLSLFESIAEKLGSELWVIGVPKPSGTSAVVKYFPWSLEAEGSLLRKIDVGIMPLRDDAWSRGKCGYKLLQYMAVGKPVVASAVGANEEIISHGETGYLVREDRDWERYLTALAANHKLSDSLGKNGAIRIISDYSLEKTGTQLLKYFDQVVNPAGHAREHTFSTPR